MVTHAEELCKQIIAVFDLFRIKKKKVSWKQKLVLLHSPQAKQLCLSDQLLKSEYKINNMK